MGFWLLDARGGYTRLAMRPGHQVVAILAHRASRPIAPLSAGQRTRRALLRGRCLLHQLLCDTYVVHVYNGDRMCPRKLERAPLATSSAPVVRSAVGGSQMRIRSYTGKMGAVDQIDMGTGGSWAFLNVMTALKEFGLGTFRILPRRGCQFLLRRGCQCFTIPSEYSERSPPARIT